MAMSQPYIRSGRHEHWIFMSTQQQTLTYRQPRVDGFTTERRPGGWLEFDEVRTTLNASSSEDWGILNGFLGNIGGTVARLEFFHWHSPQGEYRGVIIYDTYGIPLVHDVHALLGFDDLLGPSLSRKILMSLGVLESDIIELNRRAHPHRYKPIVFSREQTHGDDSNKVVIPGSPVKETWQWWFTEGNDDD